MRVIRLEGLLKMLKLERISLILGMAEEVLTLMLLSVRLEKVILLILLVLTYILLVIILLLSPC
jgi:hypothetical protein